MRWLITGGCGFIGTSLFKKIAKETNDSIRIIDNLSVGSLSELSDKYSVEIISKNSQKNNSKYEFIEGNITDKKLAEFATKDVDCVVHLAANTGVQSSIINPIKDLEENVIGTFNYLNASVKNSVNKFVFASSGAPIGNTVPPIHEKVPTNPLSPYGASKLAGEGYCSAFFHSYGLETVILRFSNVYGPGSINKSSVIAKFIKQILKEKLITINGDGSQTRDFIYVDDLLEAILKCSTIKSIGGEKFQIATGKETSINSLIKKLKEAFISINIKEIEVIKGDFLAGDIKFNYSDNSKAKKILHWLPKVGLEEGLNSTIRYFLKNN